MSSLPIPRCATYTSLTSVAAVLLLSTILPPAAAAEPAGSRPPSGLAPDDRTLALIQIDPATGDIADRTARFKPTVTGAEVFHDPQIGKCLRLTDDKAVISLKDDGKVSFQDGLTIDALIYLEAAPPRGALVALKAGSFAWDLGSGKLNTTWLAFPAEEVVTTTPTQFKTFPVGGDTINGFMNVPIERWVRLTMAYDETLGAVTTAIDGVTDRHRFRYRGGERMRCDGRSPIAFLQGMKNCRVAAIRVNTGRPRLRTPTLEVYANVLPYEQKVLLTFDHIDPDLPLPMDVTLVWEKPSGAAQTERSLTFDTHARRDIRLGLPTWKNSLHSLTVNVSAAGRTVLSRSLRIASVQPAGPITIGPDRTIRRDGKAFFPIMAYHAMPDDFAQLAELGFNVVFNDFNLNQRAREDRNAYAALLAQSLDAAEKNGLLYWAATNQFYNKLHTIPVARNHKALLGWYGADEPWGDLTKLTDSYNVIKMLAPDHPVLIVQNNYSRLQETAQGADIIATDPYPIPNVSLRAVVDATRASIVASAGSKPAWTILPQYNIPGHPPKVPSRQELRAMVWLAVVSGVNGLGIFTWDDRTVDPKTNAVTGWHTSDHKELVENLRVVLKELRRLEPVIILPNATRQPTKLANQPAVHATLRESNGESFLLIASDSRGPEQATLQLPDCTGGEATAMTDDVDAPALDLTPDGKCSIKLPPLGVGVYRLGSPKKP